MAERKQITLDIAVNNVNAATNIRELNAGLKQLISLQAQVGAGSPEFKKLTDAINETEGKIGDLNDSFSTLRGSGVERLNSSLSLLKEGFLSADPGKLAIGFDGLKAAMDAVPILLLVTGLTLLIQNFDKVSESLNGTTDSTKQAKEAIDDLQKSYDRLNKDISASNDLDQSKIALLDDQIEKLKNQKAPIEEIIKLEREQEGLRQNSFANEKVRLADEKKIAEENLALARKEGSDLLARIKTREKGSDEQKKQLDEYRKTVLDSQAIIDNYDKRVETVTNNATASSNKFFTNSAKERKEDAEAKEKELERIKKLNDEAIKNANDANERSNKEQTKQNADFYKELENRKKENTDALAKETQDQIKLEDDVLDTFIKNDKEKLDAAKTNSDKLIKLRKEEAAQTILILNAIADVTNTIGDALNENENYRFNQLQYQRDAEYQTAQNRLEESLNAEDEKAKQLLQNDSLTAEQREEIQYQSELNKFNLNQEVANQQLELDQELQKKTLELRKQQFQRDKALRLANVAIDTASAIIRYQADPGGEPGLALAIAAGITGAASAAAIASQKFDDGGASAQSNITPIKLSAPSRSSSSSASRPDIESFGTGNRFNNNLNSERGQTPIRAYVLESDITDSQERVYTIRQRSSL